MRPAMFVLALSGCMVFDESMRRSHDGSASSGSSSGGTSSGTSGASCTVDAPSTVGAAGCGGKGGAVFHGSDGEGSTIALESAICGTGAAEFSLPVSAGDCVDVFFASDDAGTRAELTPPSGSAKASGGDRDTAFHIAASGSLGISIRGNGPWQLLAR